MPLLRNNALSNHPRLNKMPRNNYEWQKWAQDLDKQKIDVSAVIGAGAIESVDSLPSLPDTDYPEGAVVFLTTDNKLYRNTDGSTWSKAVDGNDLEADTVLTNAIAAGAITASEIATDTITANEIASGTITATELNVSELSAISADMGSLTAGTITLDSSGHIKGGQTDYDTGTGFWLGQDSSTPKFSIGDSSGNKLTWNGTTLTLRGNGSFGEPENAGSDDLTWNGFSSDPSFLFEVLGGRAPDGTTGLLTLKGIPTSPGTSDSTSFSVDIDDSNLDTNIDLSGGGQLCLCIDNGTEVLAKVSFSKVNPSTSRLTFAIAETSGSNIIFNIAGWTASGDKGISEDFTISVLTA